MAKYVVLKPFHDARDKEKLYEKGQPYPRPANKRVAAKRVKELLDHGMIKKDG
jgi:hypothetical protein